jgi:hypothetical protein
MSTTIWIVRRLVDGEFESAFWQRSSASAEDAVRGAVELNHLEDGIYLAVPLPIGDGSVYKPMPVFRVSTPERAVEVIPATASAIAA